MAATKASSNGKKTNRKSTAGNRKVSTANRKTTAGNRKTATSNRKNSSSAAKKNSVSRQKSATRKNSRNAVEEMNAYQDHQAFEFGITIFVIAIVSVFLYLSYFQLTGKAGMVIGGFAFGIFGWFAWLLPLFCLIGFVFYAVNAGDRRVYRRIFSFCGMVLSLQGLSDLLFGKQIITEYYTSNHVLHRDYFECMFLTCRDVMTRGKFNGGLLGRAMSTVFSKIIGDVGACFVLVALFLFCLYLFYGLEWMGILRKRNAYRQEMEEISSQVMQDENYKQPSYRMFRNERKKSQRYRENSRQILEEETEDSRENKTRQLQKAPKVQSFDLQQLNERMDRMEQTMEAGGFSLEQSVNKKEISKAQQKKDNTAVTSKGKKQPEKKNTGVEEIMEQKNSVPEMTASSEKEAGQNAIDKIPIYRNEMNEKFGNKKQTVSGQKPVEQEIVSDRTIIEKTVTEKPATEQTAFGKPLAGKSLTEKPAIEKPATEQTVLEKAAAKPMASFAHKEEVTDVTPSSQKKREASQKTAAVMPETVTAAKKAGVKAAENSKEEKAEEVPYEFPPIDLLSIPQKAEDKLSDSELRLTASKLQDTLKSFNVNVQMGAVTCGPTVTRYELLPEQGVRVNKITNLADDLKLSLAAPSIRIEAPIPGKAAVGIEVPNAAPSAVYFRELLEGETFKNAKSDLTFAVGKDIAGKLIMADIAKMPHLLIAGATGSGKSVCINTLIMSILYKADPKDVKLIMIDPKVVELSVYNGIPHLFCPVVTDPKEAAAALNWAVREMMERYNKFKELSVRNISGYNEKIKKDENARAAGYEKMPYLVVIVDEFADLMMVASKEVEDAVCRLAQLARAAGIHLVLATQRPSVNVITGVIKANIPSRIAFSVSSVIDSRTILDKGGAEKLLGKGDMLFFPSGYSEPVRVQGAFVSDKEVSDVVDFLCNNNETPEYNHAVTEIVEVQQEEAPAVEKKPQDDRDDYFEDAGRFVIEAERAAAGQLQRHFSIGFNRAGRIIDQLHKAGVVGPAEGTKPRKVLMTKEEFEQMLHGETEGVSEEEMELMVKEMEETAVTDEDVL